MTTTGTTFTSFPSFPPTKEQIVERLFKANLITLDELLILLDKPTYQYYSPVTSTDINVIWDGANWVPFQKSPTDSSGTSTTGFKQCINKVK